MKMKMENNKKFEVNRYNKIINGLVNSSFPLLKNRKIFVKKIVSEFSAQAQMDLFYNLSVLINPKYDIYSDFEITGLLAHELCHLEDFIEKGVLWKFIHDLRYTFSEKYREDMKSQLIEKQYVKAIGKS